MFFALIWFNTMHNLQGIALFTGPFRLVFIRSYRIPDTLLLNPIHTYSFYRLDHPFNLMFVRQVPCLTCSCSFCLFVFLSFRLFVFSSFRIFVFSYFCLFVFSSLKTVSTFLALSIRGERILFFGPNTNTNNIRNQNFDRIRIRIIFVFSE